MPMQVNYSKGTANGAVIKRIIGGSDKKEPVFNFINCYNCDQETTDYLLNHLTSDYVVPQVSNNSNFYKKALLYQLFSYNNAKEIVINRVINLIPGSDAVTSINADSMFNYANVEVIRGTGGFRSTVPINFKYAFTNASKLKSVDMNVFLGTDTGDKLTNMQSMFNGCTSLEEILNLDMQNVGYGSGVVSYMFGSNSSEKAPKLKRLTFRRGTEIAKYLASDLTIDMHYITTLTRDALMEMLDTLEPNTTGKARKFQLNSAVYALLSEDDISAFTAKNYTVYA